MWRWEASTGAFTSTVPLKPVSSTFLPHAGLDAPTKHGQLRLGVTFEDLYHGGTSTDHRSGFPGQKPANPCIKKGQQVTLLWENRLTSPFPEK
jgi:hypothetical protein